MTDIIRILKSSWFGTPKVDPGIRESIERAEAEAEARVMAWISGAIAAAERGQHGVRPKVAAER